MVIHLSAHLKKISVKLDIHQICILILGSFFLLPSKATHVNTKWITRPLEIITKKEDPPRLLFDQLKKKYLTESDLFSQLQDPRIPSVRLGDSSEIVLQVSNIQERLPTRQGSELTSGWDQKPLSSNLNIENLKVELSQSQQKRLDLSGFKNEILEQNWQTPTVEDEIKKITAREVPAQTTFETSSNSRIYSLKGKITVLDGLPITKKSNIEIRHKDEDVVKALGSFNSASNGFSINVDRPSGFLVARLLDSNGFPIGEGSVRINETDKSYSINIKKARKDFSTTVAAFDNNKRRIKSEHYYSATDAKELSDELGHFSLPGIHPHSFSLGYFSAKEVKAKKIPEYLPTVTLFSSGADNQIPVFRKKMIESLKEIAKDFGYKSEYEDNGSVVWGLVQQSGKAQTGISIEVERHPNARVIYFNSFLFPDPLLNSTSESGYFAILNLPPGFHSLLARQGGLYHSHVNVVTEGDTVSPVFMESTLVKNKLTAKIFDGFEGAPVPAQISMQGLEAVETLLDETSFYLPEVNRWSLAEIVPLDREYAAVRTSYVDNSDYLHVPLIKEEWLQSLISSKRINLIPSTGTIVGFVPQDDFELYMPQLQNHLAENVVFFDSSGVMTDRPVAGGGFVVYNVPPGLHTLSLLSSQNEFIQSHLVLVDANTVFVIKSNFEI